MGAFLFHFELSTDAEGIISTIPKHRAHINNLFLEGHLLSYSVSQSRSQIWCVVSAEEEAEAMELVLGFPLFPFFVDVVCHPLLFHNNVSAAMPGISLN